MSKHILFDDAIPASPTDAAEPMSVYGVRPDILGHWAYDVHAYPLPPPPPALLSLHTMQHDDVSYTAQFMHPDMQWSTPSQSTLPLPPLTANAVYGNIITDTTPITENILCFIVQLPLFLQRKNHQFLWWSGGWKQSHELRCVFDIPQPS